MVFRGVPGVLSSLPVMRSGGRCASWAATSPGPALLPGLLGESCPASGNSVRALVLCLVLGHSVKALVLHHFREDPSTVPGPLQILEKKSIIKAGCKSWEDPHTKKIL